MGREINKIFLWLFRSLRFREWIAGMVLLLAVVPVFGQVSIQERVKDFGILRRADANWMDFEIKNATPQEVVVFRVRGSKNTDVKLSSKIIGPGESGWVRVAVSPPKEGKFSEKLEVHLSAWQKPQFIELKGESTFAASALIPCPDFSGHTAGSSNEFFVTVRDFDQNPIRDAQILIYKDGRKTTSLKTNEHGETTVNLPYGRYFFSIRNEGFSLDTAMYVNAIHKHLLAIVDPVAAPVAFEPVTHPETSYDDGDSTTTDEIADVDIADVDKNDESPLPISKYKQNNLVFLIDVSASMKQNGRMDLLKIAMIELLDILRPFDKFSLITYASDTEIMIEATQNLDKEACAAAILALEPRGTTEGAKAIDKAGKIALKHFVNDGNNQIIMATDGAFSTGVNKAVKYVSKYDKRDVTLSVLGIKCGTFTTRQMTMLVEQGRGRYIAVDGAGDAGNRLVEEVKMSSARGL